MQSNDIQKVIIRKSLLAEFAKHGIDTLEQLSAMSVQDLRSLLSIGEKTAPRMIVKYPICEDHCLSQVGQQKQEVTS